MNANLLVRAFAAAGVASALLIGFPVAATPMKAKNKTPDFGPNVIVFNQKTPLATINATLQRISKESEFSKNRHAVFFMPGTYGSDAGQHDPATATGIVNAEVGYYTAIYGLGKSPEDVRINGALHVDIRHFPNPGAGVTQTVETVLLLPAGQLALVSFNVVGS